MNSTPSDRRSFLKNGLLCAGALTLGAGCAGGKTEAYATLADKGAPALENPQSSFSMIVLPDPHYARYEETQPILDLCLAWVGANIDTLKIKALLCPGDIVQYNNAEPDGYVVRQSSAQQWASVSRAFERLDGRLSYAISLGNHDYGCKSAENRETQYGKYFPLDRNGAPQMALAERFPNARGEDSLENAAYTFLDPNWWEMMVVTLEYLPRDETIAWVKGLAADPRYQKHRIILLTHSYLDLDGTHSDEGTIGQERNLNTGKALWEKLVYPTPKIAMVLSGHRANPKAGYAGNVVRRSDKNVAGKDVFQMMFNAQTEGNSWFGNGSDGWLRILEFMPDGNTLSVRTYSPLHGISTLNRGHSWRTAPYDQFRVFIPN